MKTIFAIAILLVLSTTSVFSQFNMGVKLGYNSSLSLSSKKEEFKEYSLKKIGEEFGQNYHFGVFLRYSFARIYFQPELLYLKQHDDYEFNFKEHNVKVLTYLRYSMFEAPVLVGFKVLKSQNYSLNAYAGPRFSTKISSTLKKKNEGEPEEDFSTLIKNLDVGFALGVGFDFRNFMFDVRYNINRNISDKELFKDLPTSNFIFSLGYRII